MIDDHFAITQLLYRYASAADQRDAAAYCGCFKNGQVQICGSYNLNDGQEVIRLLTQLYSWTMHQVSNPQYQITGDQARGNCYCLASHVGEQDGQLTRLDVYLRYDDELERTEQGWVFVQRRLTVGHQHLVHLPN